MKTFLGVVSLVGLGIVKAQVPAGQPVDIQIRGGPSLPCFVPFDLTDGAAVVLGVCANIASQAWVVDAGGPVVGSGPPTQIHIGDYCLDVRDGNEANGAPLQIWTCSAGNPNQVFSFNGDGSISWVGKNKCVDLTNGDQTLGTSLQLWDCISGNINQSWIYRLAEPSPVLRAPVNTPILLKTFLVSPRSAPCLTAASFANGAKVTLESCTTPSPANQIWTVVKGGAAQSSHPNPGPIGQIKIFGNMCLDLTDGNTTTGTQLQIWDCAPEGTNQNQLWSIWGDATLVWGGDSQFVGETLNFSFAVGTPVVIGTKDFSASETWNAVAPQ